jgi:NAD(P)-dependent dehydrogenase (short-subunit alcohol dehydrogenase family)
LNITIKNILYSIITKMFRFSKKALIVGGNSQFGSELVKEFAKKWQVTSIDTSENVKAH